MIFEPLELLLAGGALPVAAAALLVERLFGYPNGPQAWIGHPVQWMGALIGALDRWLNTGGARKARGSLALFCVVAIILALTVPLTHFLRGQTSGWIGEALLASTLLSQKSLEDHVCAVADGLKQSLKAGREAVSHIIGRDPDTLDESGVTKGALESLAENMSDGVFAPLFWLLIAGLPGIALYKAINTADSMIGYKSGKYREFGWASARVDDLVNLIPARLTGWLIALAAALSRGFSGRGALRAMASDARKHLSPNAGWPEAAFAGALGIRLGGPRSYQGRKADLAWMGDGRTKLGAEDIGNGLRLYNTGLNIVTALVILMWMI
ncbi:MAG: adenosylcobinamide-phosphate synthase CbiB [Alphaproteobacteria bacterium]